MCGFGFAVWNIATSMRVRNTTLTLQHATWSVSYIPEVSVLMKALKLASFFVLDVRSVNTVARRADEQTVTATLADWLSKWHLVATDRPFNTIHFGAALNLSSALLLLRLRCSCRGFAVALLRLPLHQSIGDSLLASDVALRCCILHFTCGTVALTIQPQKLLFSAVCLLDSRSLESLAVCFTYTLIPYTPLAACVILCVFACVCVAW